LFNVFPISATSQTIVQLMDATDPSIVLAEMALDFYARFWCTDPNGYIYLVENGSKTVPRSAHIHKIDVLNATDVEFYFLTGLGDNPWRCLEGPIWSDGTNLWWISCSSINPSIGDKVYVLKLVCGTMTLSTETYTGWYHTTAHGSHLECDGTYLYWWYRSGVTSGGPVQYLISNVASKKTASPSRGVTSMFIAYDDLYEIYTLSGQNCIRRVTTADMVEQEHWTDVRPGGLGIATDTTYVFWNGVGSTYLGKVGATSSLLSDFSRVDSIWETMAQSNAVWYMQI